MKIWESIKKIINSIPYIKHKIEEKERAQREAEAWKRLATSDDLTGLPNRFCFNLYWKELRHKATISIVDIDYFKKINDTYGHLKGNEVLVRVARILEKNNHCFTFRYGGEEFLVVCINEFSTKQIMEKMENLRKQVEMEMSDINLTISVGVSLVGGDFIKLFEQADKALYISKNSGRNQVTRYSNKITFSTLHTEDVDGNIQKRE